MGTITLHKDIRLLIYSPVKNMYPIDVFFFCFFFQRPRPSLRPPSCIIVAYLRWSATASRSHPSCCHWSSSHISGGWWQGLIVNELSDSKAIFSLDCWVTGAAPVHCKVTHPRASQKAVLLRFNCVVFSSKLNIWYLDFEVEIFWIPYSNKINT